VELNSPTAIILTKTLQTVDTTTWLQKGSYQVSNISYGYRHI